MTDEKMADYLAENPRMIGVLFTASLLLMEVAPVLAGGGDGTAGP